MRQGLDLEAVRCFAVLAIVIAVSIVVFIAIDRLWRGPAKRPLKEKSAKQKALEKKRTRRLAQGDTSDDSRWQRPGGPLRPKPPIFGEGQPRHVRIDNTPRVIIPHETVGPQTGHASYQRNMPAVRIKPVDVSPEPKKTDNPSSERTGFIPRID